MIVSDWLPRPLICTLPSPTDWVLYTIKSELEDLSLKYTDRKQYDFIKRKLNETKRSRDAYIAEFIAPIKRKLAAAGFKFDIKGRTNPYIPLITS